MTLAFAKKSACLFVSADDDSHLDLALQDTTAIQKCWCLIQEAIKETNPSVARLEQIIKSTLVRGFILHHLKSGRQHSRFQKRSRECAAWFAFLRTNLRGWTKLGAVEKSYCDISEEVFHLYEHAIAEGVWTDQDLAKLCEYADAIQNLEIQSKGQIRLEIRWVGGRFRLTLLEKMLPLPLNDLPLQRDFDPTRYIDKLIQPALRAINLYGLCKRPIFRRMFKNRHLHITEVRAAEYGAQYSSPPLSTDTVHGFVHGLRGEVEDKAILIGEIDSAIPTYANYDVAFRSHSECHLIRYHDEHPSYSGRPFPYIATYRPSGYLSQYFVKAHRLLARYPKDLTKRVGFILPGWKTRIEMGWCFPVVLPDHIYSLIGLWMHDGLVKLLNDRMDLVALRRGRRRQHIWRPGTC
ncbi:hypothetical protein VNI00_002039 [Paramarasmius palmivorus]|uniref:Uncharacterized protein n=1 Tax=Paramarasmius palmivorus TaxID=297713 RepID=A0AAW0E460_9AGAR